MEKIILDTNILIEITRGQNQELFQSIIKFNPKNLYINNIIFTEFLSCSINNRLIIVMKTIFPILFLIISFKSYSQFNFDYNAQTFSSATKE